jgi:hypothetical protein
MSAYRAVRSPLVQPSFLEKAVSVSERKSCYHNHQRPSPEPAARVEGTYNIVILDTIGLAPRTQDKRIVECNDGYGIDALALECAQVVDVAGEVLGGAGGSEGTRDGEDDDFLVGPFYSSRVLASVGRTEDSEQGGVLGFSVNFRGVGRKDRDGRWRARRRKNEHTFAGIVVNGHTTSSDVAALGGVWDVAELHTAWDAISDFEFSHFACCFELIALLKRNCMRLSCWLFGFEKEENTVGDM